MAPTEPRRTPQQRRSRERFERIVEAARALIGSVGNDAVSVREIAAKARVPVSSVYQYFPDKTAILRQLMERYLGLIRERLFRVFGDLRSPAELPGAADAAFDVFFRLYDEEPGLATIWAGVQASPALRLLDAEDTRQNAQLFAAEVRRVLPDVDPDEIFEACFFAAHVAGATMRDALGAGREDRVRLFREMKRLSRLRLMELIARQRSAPTKAETRAGLGRSRPRHAPSKRGRALARA